MGMEWIILPYQTIFDLFLLHCWPCHSIDGKICHPSTKSYLLMEQPLSYCKSFKIWFFQSRNQKLFTIRGIDNWQPLFSCCKSYTIIILIIFICLCHVRIFPMSIFGNEDHTKFISQNLMLNSVPQHRNRLCLKYFVIFKEAYIVIMKMLKICYFYDSIQQFGIKHYSCYIWCSIMMMLYHDDVNAPATLIDKICIPCH